MRITNQMLANSAAKSGISLQGTSLLNILNHKSSTGLLGSIGNNTSTSASKILKKSNYSKLEDLSENLNKYALKLTDSAKDSIYDKAKESGNALTAGIKDATFMGVEFANVTSQKTGDAFKTLALKLDIDGYGEYTQNFFEPQSDERKQMQWGPTASPLDHFLITVREILEAVDPQIISDIDAGTKTLSGNFKQIVDAVKAFTAPMVGKARVQVKLIPQSNGFVSMPSFPARITRNGDLGIATRIIGQNLVLTPNELKRIEAAKSAAPTNMASQVDTSTTLDAMAENLGMDNDKEDDLPF